MLFCKAHMVSNPLRTTLEALQFAIEFAQMDLTQASREDEETVRARIQELALLTGQPRANGSNDDPLWIYTRDGSIKWQVTDSAIATLTIADMQHIQADLFHLLARIAAGSGTSVRVKLTLVVMGPFHATGEKPDPVVTIGVSGPPRDQVLYRVIRFVEELGTERVKACPEPKCGRLFFKVTRKEFCSTKCQSRSYMRKLRHSPKAGLKEATSTANARAKRPRRRARAERIEE